MSKSPALRRIQADIRELSIEPSDRYHAHPLENDMFEWHFTIRGADGTDFEGGYYHGRILLPAEYPFKPPNIVFLTPSGRFEVNTKVCLSFSAYHPELWQPAWGIRLILEALVSFLPTKGDGAIGALDWTSEERRRLAKKSVDYVCPVCGKCSDILKRIEKKIAMKGDEGKKGSQSSMFQKEIEHLVAMQMANHDGSVTNKDENICESFSEEEVAISDNTERGARGKEEVILVEEAAVGDDPDANSQPVDVIDVSDPKETADYVNGPSLEIEENVPGSGTSDKAEVPIEDKATQNDSENNNFLDNAVEESQEQECLHSPLLSDPVVHAGIAIFSIIVLLLVRKLNAIIDDMKELESEFRELNK